MSKPTPAYGDAKPDSLSVLRTDITAVSIALEIHSARQDQARVFIKRNANAFSLNAIVDVRLRRRLRRREMIF